MLYALSIASYGVIILLVHQHKNTPLLRRSEALFILNYLLMQKGVNVPMLVDILPIWLCQSASEISASETAV